MRILVLSDLHHRKLDIDITKYDYVICSGDYGHNIDILKNTYFVCGNCDIGNKNDLEFTIDNIKYFLTHGHLYGVKESYNRLVYKALSVNAKICVFGHTHRQAFFNVDGTYFINPGAYKDGYYCIIENNEISFYLNKELVLKDKMEV